VNQWWESSVDAKMNRTSNRPLPAGRLSHAAVLAFGGVTLLAGLVEFALFVNWTELACSTATWLVYVLLYTPLKSRSPHNTAVGAVSGALPILIGWTAAGGEIGVTVLALATVVFLWQFPHFMAIAWRYREDYARAGHQMLTVVDPSGFRAGRQAVIASLALLPVSLVPALSPTAGSPAVYSVWATFLAIGLLAASIGFLVRRSDQSARLLLRASLVYLVCWMGLLLIVAV
jgi:protoheme IX farnesyltransferase